MASNVITPSIDQAKLLLFEQHFYQMAQQKTTKLLNTPAIRFMGIKGISNVARMGKSDLQEVTGIRNPEKQYVQAEFDNRKSKARRFTRTYLLDNYDAAVNLITNPTSQLFDHLKWAKDRKTDLVISDAARGDIVIGAPDGVNKTISAEEDGVVTIDGTSAFDYAHVISPSIKHFVNNDIDVNGGVTLAITGTEEEQLRNDEMYKNSLYSKNNTVDKGRVDNVSGYNVVTFAGSENGFGRVDNPVLKELPSGIRESYYSFGKNIKYRLYGPK